MVTTRSSKNGKITSFFEKKKTVEKEEIKEEEIGKTTNKKRKIDNNETTSTNLIKKVKKTTTNKKEDKPLLNPVLGTDFDFEPIDTEKEMKIVSYNVGSLNASLKKGFKNYLEAENPDIICIQETKVNAPTHDISRKDYPYQYWTFSTVKKGYSGCAVFSKIKPLSVEYGIGCAKFDDEGRNLVLEFENYYLIATYVPNAGNKLVRLDFKQEYSSTIEKFFKKLEEKKPIIWAGDLNVAHQKIDLAKPDSNLRSAGYTIEERTDFTRILSSNPPRIDTFRHFHPKDQIYSYFSYRFNCHAKNIGWRLDYFVVSEKLLPQIKDSLIRTKCYGASDHVPICLIMKKN
ncbi:Endonuclease/exonuclease/phosphatase [Neocallimastix lanati (nom. inval.)]|nr:Endonuclease/exonuclease/phosphatase [Neocallimastix sp. JGI-2020a]